MTTMTLEELRALLEVIEAGSINRAATRLKIPRSTLTRRLEALETGFGTPLLTVSRDGAQPTEAGARLARGAEALLHQAAELDASVRLGLETPTRPVHIVMPTGLAPIQQAMGLLYMRQRLPGLQLRVSVQANPFEYNGEGHPDCIISFGRPKLGDYRVFQLLRMHFAFIASASYLERKGNPTSVDELDDHELWVWEGALMSSGGNKSVLLHDGSRLPITPAFVVNDVHLLHIIAQRGMGLVLAPNLPFVLSHSDQDNEVEILHGTLGGDIGLWTAVPERNVELSWTRRLLDELRAFFNNFETLGIDMSIDA